MENYLSGGYEFVLSSNAPFTIRVKFVIEVNGSISVNEPEIL